MIAAIFKQTAVLEYETYFQTVYQLTTIANTLFVQYTFSMQQDLIESKQDSQPTVGKHGTRTDMKCPNGDSHDTEYISDGRRKPYGHLLNCSTCGIARSVCGLRTGQLSALPIHEKIKNSDSYKTIYRLLEKALDDTFAKFDSL